ncbi:MAG: ACP S-malonyltransferase [Acidobacteria bacterium]|nr:ACP S-malonyltransferase [Acidobacteriota bacterium]
MPMQAFVFPGQGSQYPGMGQDLVDEFDEARQVFDEADEALGFSLSRLCFEGPEEQLRLTEKTQPAMLAVSIALFRILEKRENVPDYVAGHSVGEYAALVAAGGLDFQDAVRLVHQRGRFMQEAVPVGEGAMAAVMGLELSDVKQICQEAALGEVVSPANINTADQIVISGHRRAVERAAALAQVRGARKVRSLPVSAPFHCGLMKPAQERLARVLEEITFQDLRVPLVNNLEAREVRDATGAREGLIGQVSSPVLWSESIERLVEAGVSTFVEVGPGRVLRGLIRRIAPSVKVYNVGNREQVESYA